MAAMEKNNKNLNVPNLRFPEFSGEWEKCSLGEIGHTSIGLTYSPADVVKEDGIIVLRSSNIQDGEIDYKDLVRVNKKIKDSLFTKKDDILICARNGSPRLIGKNALISDVDAGHSYGAFMMVYRSEENPFVRQLLCTKRYFAQVGENLGARINQITTSDMNSFEFFFPQSKEERNKIALFLRIIDERISTQKKIIEKYESLIRGLYHSIFNNPSSIYYLQLREVVSVVKGKQVNGEELFEEGKYYVMNGGTEPSGYLNEYNTPADTISISEGGNSCGYVQYNKEPFWSGGHCYSLMPKSENICYRFLYHFLKYKENDIMALRIGSGLPNIQKKDIERFEVQLPSLERQREVTTLLDAISAKLDLEKQLHHVWQPQKQYLLGSLFI